MTMTRLQRREKWNLDTDGAGWAKIGCGQRDADGVQRCRGVVGELNIGGPVPGPVVCPGMQRRSNVLRPTRAALRVYRKTGMLQEPQTRSGTEHLARLTQDDVETQRTFELPELRGLLVECPRCHTEQRFNLDELRSAMLASG